MLLAKELERNLKEQKLKEEAEERKKKAAEERKKKFEVEQEERRKHPNDEPARGTHVFKLPHKTIRLSFQRQVQSITSTLIADGAIQRLEFLLEGECVCPATSFDHR